MRSVGVALFTRNLMIDVGELSKLILLTLVAVTVQARMAEIFIIE